VRDGETSLRRNSGGLHRELLADALAEHAGLELAGSAPGDVAATAAMFEPSVVVVNTATVRPPTSSTRWRWGSPQRRSSRVGFRPTTTRSCGFSRQARRGSARTLSIERATVKNHVHTILFKLIITRRDQVAARLQT
jgi:hypothetical protein